MLIRALVLYSRRSVSQKAGQLRALGGGLAAGSVPAYPFKTVEDHVEPVFELRIVEPAALGFARRCNSWPPRVPDSRLARTARSGMPPAAHLGFAGRPVRLLHDEAIQVAVDEEKGPIGHRHREPGGPQQAQDGTA